MRPLLSAVLIVVSGAVAGVCAGGGAAQTSIPGDGCLVVQGGFGKVTITLSRGVVFGRFQAGTLTYSDKSAETNLPRVPLVTPTKFGDHLWVYGPADYVRFRSSGPTKLIVNAQSINLSVAGKGTASISAAGWDGVPATLTPPSNAFSADANSFCEDNFAKMPPTPTKVQISSPVAG